MSLCLGLGTKLIGQGTKLTDSRTLPSPTPLFLRPHQYPRLDTQLQIHVPAQIPIQIPEHSWSSIIHGNGNPDHDTTLQGTTTHCGRPNWTEIFQQYEDNHPGILVSSSPSPSPPALAALLQSLPLSYNPSPSPPAWAPALAPLFQP